MAVVLQRFAGMGAQRAIGPRFGAEVIHAPFWPRSFTGYSTAEQRLMAAVLEDAWSLYSHPEQACGDDERGLLARTEQWFASDDPLDWPFTFRNVCSVLGHDPAEVRASLPVRGVRIDRTSLEYT